MSGDEMRLVGKVLPGFGAPPKLGDIYASETLIAQKGEAYVLRMVRETFRAAYDQHWNRRKP